MDMSMIEIPKFQKIELQTKYQKFKKPLTRNIVNQR